MKIKVIHQNDCEEMVEQAKCFDLDEVVEQVKYWQDEKMIDKGDTILISYERV